jgi:hypothetical protein
MIMKVSSFSLLLFSVFSVVAAMAEEKTLMFNGTPIQVNVDKAYAMTLAGSNFTFEDKLGRKLIIQDFEFDNKSGKHIINAKITLNKGQTTTIHHDKACKGLIGNDIKVKHSRTPDHSTGSLDLKQEGDRIIFATTNGFVNLGVSFYVDDALSGELEGRMFFDYFTAGATVRAVSDIKIHCTQ